MIVTNFAVIVDIEFSFVFNSRLFDSYETIDILRSDASTTEKDVFDKIG